MPWESAVPRIGEFELLVVLPTFCPSALQAAASPSLQDARSPLASFAPGLHAGRTSTADTSKNAPVRTVEERELVSDIVQEDVDLVVDPRESLIPGALRALP